ncbi:unnamed protein product, partial [Brenthis ino]
MGDGCIELPIYSIYIIGAGYLLMIVAIIYLLCKIYYKKRNVYKTLESVTTNNNESDDHITSTTKQDLEGIFRQATYKYILKDVDERDNSTETIDTYDELSHNGDFKNHDKISQSKHRAVEMITNTNPNVVALISPEQMKQVVQKVLKKTKSSNSNLKTSECENEIIINEENVQKLSEKRFNNRKSASISDIYDVVRSPKPIRVKILSFDDSILLNKRKKSCIVIRDTCTGYDFPWSNRKTYENAHLIP